MSFGEKRSERGASWSQVCTPPAYQVLPSSHTGIKSEEVAIEIQSSQYDHLSSICIATVRHGKTLIGTTKTSSKHSEVQTCDDVLWHRLHSRPKGPLVTRHSTIVPLLSFLVEFQPHRLQGWHSSPLRDFYTASVALVH